VLIDHQKSRSSRHDCQCPAGDRETCFLSGMNDFISKPIRSAELSAIMVERFGFGKFGGNCGLSSLLPLGCAFTFLAVRSYGEPLFTGLFLQEAGKLAAYRLCIFLQCGERRRMFAGDGVDSRRATAERCPHSFRLLSSCVNPACLRACNIRRSNSNSLSSASCWAYLWSCERL